MFVGAHASYADWTLRTYAVCVCVHMHVCVCVFSRIQATRCFREARFGPGRDPDEGADLARIEFNEFVEAVCRVALVAYNYQVHNTHTHTHTQ